MAIGNRAKQQQYDNSDGTLSASNTKDALDELNSDITAEDIWDRASATISPKTAGDDVDMGTGKYKVGSNTEIYESSGDTYIRNTSATKSIFRKLGDVAGDTFAKVVDSAGAVLHHVKSDGEVQNGKTSVDGVSEVKDASGVVQDGRYAVTDNYGKGLYFPMSSQSLADDAEVTVANGKAGIGLVNIGDNQEYALVSFSTTAVTLVINSTNVANSDSDTNLCIYYDGTDLKIKNRLGSALTTRFFVLES
jgi:hypothetical protein